MSDPIRIAVIEQDVGIGGAEVNLFYLFREMDRSRFEAVVIVPREGPLTARLKELGVAYRLIPRPKFMPTSSYLFGKKIFNPFAVLYDVVAFMPAIWRIRNFLRRENINVVHTNAMVAHIYGGIAARLAGIPCIWHMQDIVDPKMAFGVVRRVLVFLGGILPKKIVVVSKAVGEMFNGKGASRLHVIYNGADFKKFSPEVDGSAVRKEFGISEGELVVGMVGRLTQWKGQREFLRAAARIDAEIGNVRFLVVGGTTFSKESYLDELHDLTHALALTGKVIFSGFRTDIPQLTSAMDICVLPSVLPDPCPLVLFDYMASAKPIVASSTGGIPEIIEHGEDGLLVDARKADELADAILRLLKDEPLRRRISEAAQKKVEKYFSIEKFVQQFEQLYLETAH